MNKDLEKLYELDKQIQVLKHANAVLGWDREVLMPEKGISERGEQLAVLEGIIHEKTCSAEAGELLEKLGAPDGSYKADSALTEADKAFIRNFHRNYSRNIKIPEQMVREFARETAIAQQVWAKARLESDFAKFSPHLAKLVDLSREKAELLGYKEHPYDPLLDEFEPWTSTAEIDAVFSDLQRSLVPFVAEISSKDQVDDSFLMRKYDVNRQEEFSRFILTKMGFSTDRGRLDVSTHPFTTTLGPDDIRITTRYNENFFKTSIFGTIHECGHALYELGMGPAFAGSNLADCPSLGIHESQSRTWENMIGRSREFWNHFFPILQSHFPQALSDVDSEKFYRGVNKVEPSFIRVEADEVTYSLHIILRFNIEKELIKGNIRVGDLPEIWNTGMKDLLGITPRNDAEGVLQDIHWSFAGFGYFPTYALGNLYGAQFFDKMCKDLPDLNEEIASGDLMPAKMWLGENIHRTGSLYSAEDLCQKVSGEKLDSSFFMNYIKRKYTEIYNI